MNNKSPNFRGLSDALEWVPTATMDSAFENSIVVLLRSLDAESAWKLVRELLTNPRASARALGLRVVRRQFKDKEQLGRVVHLCFSVERLAELQYWYTAILSRFPVMDFAKKLEIEAVIRKDADFISLHLRALQMHKADGSVAKKRAVTMLMGLASSADWARGRQQTGTDGTRM